MLIDLSDDEIHQILESLDYTSGCFGTDDEKADECERIWRKIYDAAEANVTRLEVIGDGGRLFTSHQIRIDDAQFQDNNRTLKIFIRGDSFKEK